MGATFRSGQRSGQDAWRAQCARRDPADIAAIRARQAASRDGKVELNDPLWSVFKRLERCDHVPLRFEPTKPKGNLLGRIVTRWFGL